MFVRIWRYRITEGAQEAFERAYGPEGDWARLFGRAEGYLGTELLSAAGGSAYVTIDRWRGRGDWIAFLSEHGEEYESLDRTLGSLTLEQENIGDWEAV